MKGVRMNTAYYVTQESDSSWDAIVEFDDHSYIESKFCTVEKAQFKAAEMVARILCMVIDPATVPVICATRQEEQEMYDVIEQEDHTWIGYVRIQDGLERTVPLKSKGEAICAVIRVARSLNGVYILSSEVAVRYFKAEPTPGPQAELMPQGTVDKILNGDLVLVPWDAKILKYRITDDECEEVLARREGRVNECARF